jgi:hypothetical protein
MAVAAGSCRGAPEARRVPPGTAECCQNWRADFGAAPLLRQLAGDGLEGSPGWRLARHLLPGERMRDRVCAAPHSFRSRGGAV